MGRPKIIRPYSRQRAWQIKMRDEGRCMICGDEAVRRGYCEEHYCKLQERNLRRQKQKYLKRKTMVRDEQMEQAPA